MDALTVRDDSPCGGQTGFRDFVLRFSRVFCHARVVPSISQKLRCLRHKSFPLHLRPACPFHGRLGLTPDFSVSASIPLRSVPPLVPFVSPA